VAAAHNATGAAITLGRAPMKGIHPAIKLYERNDDGTFELALELP
jgi:hypothetical protein